MEIAVDIINSINTEFERNIDTLINTMFKKEGDLHLLSNTIADFNRCFERFHIDYKLNVNLNEDKICIVDRNSENELYGIPIADCVSIKDDKQIDSEEFFI